MHSQLSRILSAVIVVAFLSVTALTAYAAVLTTHQGRLTDAAGAPLPDGDYQVTFKVYENMAAPAPLWTEIQTVSLKDGLFGVTLGLTTPLGEDILAPLGAGGDYLANTERNITVTVNGYPELPRVRLTGVPYAAVATRVTGDVETRPGKIVVRETGVVNKGTGGRSAEMDALLGFLLFNPNSTAPKGGIRLHDAPSPDNLFEFFVDESEIAPGHAVLITPDGMKLDQNEDGSPDFEVNTLTNTFNVANTMATTLSGSTKVTNVFTVRDATDAVIVDVNPTTYTLTVPNPAVATTIQGTVNVNNAFSVDADNDAVKELYISALGETIGRNGLYWYIGSNITPRFSIDNAGTIYMDPNGSATSAGMSYSASTLAFNLRGSPLTLDLNRNGVADVNFSTSGLCTFDSDLDGITDYSFGGTLCTISKPCGFSADGDATREFQINAAGDMVSDPDEDAVNELAVTDNSMICKASLECDPDGDLVNELEVSADAVDIDADLWLIGNESIDADADGDEDWYTFTIGPNDNGFAFNPDGVDIPLILCVGDHVDVAGDFNCTGTKNFVQPHPADPAKEIVYVSLEGGEAGTYTRGSSKLKDGTAVIDLPEHFALVTNTEGLTAQITPRGPVQSMLYVESATPAHLIVRASNPRDSDVRFDYLVNGVRAGYEDHQVIRDNRQVSNSR